MVRTATKILVLLAAGCGLIAAGPPASAGHPSPETQPPPNSDADSGRLVAHRLNRFEYRNTIHDLLGVTFNPAANFPADDSGYGFDNIGSVLSVSPLLLERYFEASAAIVKDPHARQRIFVCAQHDSGCARTILSTFARRAYRRPVSSGEVDRLAELEKSAEHEGEPFEQAVLLAIRAILVSPNFLFRIEAEPNAGPSDGRLTDLELASRLSYFLWSSTPDEELLALAEQNRLRTALEQQVRRMLADPKSSALASNFGGQWLQFRNVNSLHKDRTQFPEFDRELRSAMITETLLFFEAILREDRSIFDFIDAKFTFVNERLAKLYGIPDITGTDFQPVHLEGDQRGGILGQASVLAVSSLSDRTSPVLRGKFILENILNQPPPPPPANVPQLSEADQQRAISVRKRLEQHRSNPACASCHNRMDPLGFALDNYDAIGRWRESEAGSPVDASGSLPDGRSFSGPAELRELLKTQPDRFREALTSKLMTYALGRGLEHPDDAAVRLIMKNLAENSDRFSRLIVGIVESEPFQTRSAPPVRQSQVARVAAAKAR